MAPTGPLTLRGPALALRLPRAGDAEALFALACDPEVVRYFSWGPYTAREQAAAWLERQAAERDRGERLELVIAAAGDRPIGVTGFSEPALRDRRAVIGTWLGREHWGTGANREAKALMCHLGFALLGLERIAAYASPHHARSRRALERLGFVEEGVLRAFHQHRGEPRDVVVGSLLRGEWKRGPLREIAVRVEGEPGTWARHWRPAVSPGAPPS